MKRLILLFFIILNLSAFAYDPNKNLINKLDNFGNIIERKVKADNTFLSKYSNEIDFLKKQYHSNDKAMYILNFFNKKIIYLTDLMDAYYNIKKINMI